MGRGLLVLVLGGLALAAGFVSATWWESSQRPAPVVEFPVSWSTELSPSVVHDGHLEEGNNESYAFTVRDANITWTETRLVWEEDSGETSTFRVNVTSPWGETWTNETNDEIVVVEVHVAEVPGASSVNATSQAEATDSAYNRFVSVRGQGTWEVEVTLVEAPGQRPVPGSDVETQPDGDNDYQIQFRYETYQASVEDEALG